MFDDIPICEIAALPIWQGLFVTSPIQGRVFWVHPLDAQSIDERLDLATAWILDRALRKLDALERDICREDH